MILRTVRHVPSTRIRSTTGRWNRVEVRPEALNRSPTMGATRDRETLTSVGRVAACAAVEPAASVPTARERGSRSRDG